MYKDSNYSELLSRIDVVGEKDSNKGLQIKHNLVMRAMVHLALKETPIGKAWETLWGGGRFQSGSAAIAIINGWRKLPEHRCINHNWYLTNAYDADDSSVQIVADAVAEIQERDRREAYIADEKKAERKERRKMLKCLREKGYVMTYVNPKDIETINSHLGDAKDKSIKIVVRDGVLVLEVE